MFALPPLTHKARELMGDLATLAEQLNPANAGKLLPVFKARHVAMAAFEGAGLKPKRVAMVILRYDTDQKWLVTFGPKGGWRKEWNFGTGRPA